jgi:hypothetical protein
MADEPNKLQTIVKDAKLLAAALQYTKRTLTEETLQFYLAKGEPKVVYERFVSNDAPMQVNLPGPITGPMHQLAEKKDWTNAAWKNHLDKAKESIAGLWEHDAGKRFLESAEFRATPAGQKAAAEAAAKNATSTVLATQKAASSAVKAGPAPAAQPEAPAAEPKKADPKKAAKLLGITNAKSIALLTKANDLSFKGDKSGALRVFAELVENEKLKMTAEMFMKELQKQIAKNPNKV